jgi:hypothetical protein
MMKAILRRIEAWSSRTVLYVLTGMAIGSVIVSATANMWSNNLSFGEWLGSATF